MEWDGDGMGMGMGMKQIKLVRHIKQWEEVSAMEFDRPYTVN